MRQKRPEIDPSWCFEVIANPIRVERQSNGRFRFLGEVTRPGENVARYLRVITLEDGETVLNAFFDRRFKRE